MTTISTGPALNRSPGGFVWAGRWLREAASATIRVRARRSIRVVRFDPPDLYERLLTLAKTPRKWTGARSPSGLKRVRSSARRHDVLGPRRAAAKTLVKTALAVATSPNGDDPQVALAEAISALDRAVKSGAIHRNAAARRKSRLTIKVNALAGGAVAGSGPAIKTVSKAAAQKAAKARIAAGKAGKAKGAQTAAGKARAALSRSSRAEAAAAAAAAASKSAAAKAAPKAKPGAKAAPKAKAASKAKAAAKAPPKPKAAAKAEAKPTAKPAAKPATKATAKAAASKKPAKAAPKKPAKS